MLRIFGYLDPSSGSIIIQSIIGIIAGIGLFGRRVFSDVGHKIKNVLSRGNSSDSSD